MCSEKHNSYQTTLNADACMHLHSSHAHVAAVKISKIRKKKKTKQEKPGQKNVFGVFFVLHADLAEVRGRGVTSARCSAVMEEEEWEWEPTAGPLYSLQGRK